MRSEWIDSGYFIVSDVALPDRGDGLLPPRIVTVSTCLAVSYPDAWALPWATFSAVDLENHRMALALDESEFSALRAWVDEAMQKGEYGWPNVFLSLDAARQFGQRFLGAVKDRRLLGLSLMEDFARKVVLEEAPGEGQLADGIWTAVSRARPLAPRASPLGFDVLGIELGGSFHTFTCNDLVRDYHERLGITFNEHGLIDDYAAALAACEYTNREDTGAEPVGWYPFRVDEYDATDTG